MRSFMTGKRMCGQETHIKRHRQNFESLLLEHIAVVASVASFLQPLFVVSRSDCFSTAMTGSDLGVCGAQRVKPPFLWRREAMFSVFSCYLGACSPPTTSQRRKQGARRDAQQEEQRKRRTIPVQATKHAPHPVFVSTSRLS